jgi:membrane associated rhomboid family serine protease
MMNNNSLWDDFKFYVIHTGNVATRLIAVNSIVFLILGIASVICTLAQVPYVMAFVHEYLDFPSNPMMFLFKPWTIITYQFIHAGFFHLLFNMITLVWSARIFAEFLGQRKMLALYLTGGMVGALVYMGAYQLIPFFAPNSNQSTLVGASASIMAILSAIATLLPEYRISLMFIGSVRIRYLVYAFFIIDLLSLVGSNAGGSFAHLGGFIWGVVYIKSLQKGVNLGEWMSNTLDFIQNPLPKKSFSSNKGYTPRPNTQFSFNSSKDAANKESSSFNANERSKFSFVDEQYSKTHIPSKISQEEVDAILEKIKKSGYDSLSKSEKDILFKASNQ